MSRRTIVGLVAVAGFGLAVACSQAIPQRAASVRVTTTTTTTTSSTTTTTTPPTTTTEPPTTTTEAPPPPPPPRVRVAPAPAPAPDPAPAPVRARASTPGSAGQVVSLANQFRADNGVAALSPAADANAKAQQHAEDMAARGSIYHSSSLSSGIDPGWTSLGENVGVGASVSDIEAMFEQSTTHRGNLLNGDFTEIGAGVAQGADGRIYVCQFFVGR